MLKERYFMLHVWVITLLMLVVSGCATGHVTQISDVKISGPRVIALDAPSAPWVIEIQNRLKHSGFKVLRWSSRIRVTERTERDRLEQYNRAEARYVLVIDGFAPYDWANRCFGGGYKFQTITADLVDVQTNETILNIKALATPKSVRP